MFDFNGDGRTDSGEQYTGYQIFKDTTDGFGNRPKTGGGKLGLFDIIMIGLFVLEILNILSRFTGSQAEAAYFRGDLPFSALLGLHKIDLLVPAATPVA